MSALIIPIIILIACFVVVAKIGYRNLTGKKDNLDAVMGSYTINNAMLSDIANNAIRQLSLIRNVVM